MNIVRQSGLPHQLYTINRASNQARGLVAWWPPSGGVRDLVSGTVLMLNSATLSLSSIGHGISMAGSGTGAMASYVLDVPLTISLWFRWGSASNRVLAGTFGTGWNGHYIGYDASGYPNASSAASTTFTSASGTTVLSTSLHTHLCAVFASTSSRKIYVNGVLQATDTTTKAPTGLATLAVGDWTGAPADGHLADVRYYNVALTDAEVWQLYDPLTRWDLYEPARRLWPVYVAPAAATPVLSTIYINSADIGDTSLFDDVSGAAVSSTYARTGSKSFKLDGSDYLQADLTSSATKYSKFGLLVTATPASDALLVAWQETGTEHVSLYLTDKLTLQMRQGSTIIQTSPTTLVVNTWYCIETKIVVHTTTGRFQVRIDGVDDMSAIGVCTDADVDGVINEIRFESAVDDTYIDDIVVREDQWCGTGGVYVIGPTAAGSVEEWTGAYTDVDDLPPSFTDYLSVTAESGSDQLFRHGGLGGNYDVSVVGVFAKGKLDTDAVEISFYALVRSSLTDNVGYAQTLDTIGVYARQLLTTDPNGTVAWTAYAVDNALQIGVRG